MVIARERGNIGAPCGGWAPCSLTFRRPCHLTRDGVAALGQLAAPVAGHRLPAVLPSYDLSSLERRWDGVRTKGGFVLGAPAAFGPAVLRSFVPCAAAGRRSDKWRPRLRGHLLLVVLAPYYLPLSWRLARLHSDKWRPRSRGSGCRLQRRPTTLPFLARRRGGVRTKWRLRSGGIGCLLPCRVTTFFPFARRRGGVWTDGGFGSECRLPPPYHLTALLSYEPTYLRGVGAARVLAGRF